MKPSRETSFWISRVTAALARAWFYLTPDERRAALLILFLFFISVVARLVLSRS